MNVLSLFDGISCAMVALERTGISVEHYYASEVDKYAIQVSKKNYPKILHIGDVRDVVGIMDVDLLIGGSPCQDLSIAKRDRQGLQGERSGLFWEYVRILHTVQPKYFILENVASMPKDAKDEITKTLGVEPVMIDAALVSAQRRKRLFWTNIPTVTQPVDRGIVLNDILISAYSERDKSLVLTATYSRACPTDYFRNSSRQLVATTKSYCLPASYYKENLKSLQKRGKNGLFVLDFGTYRKLTPIECERLQGLPDDYTEGISNTQRYKCLGNAFNVDVIAHILSFIP